jgi:TonB family protein
VATFSLSDLQRLDTDEAVLEIVVLWGEQSVLHVAHLSPPRTFCVGDAVDAHGKLATDFLIGSESIGLERLPITTESAAGPQLIVPKGASAELDLGGELVTHAQLLAQGMLAASSELDGALQCRLPSGSSARLHHRGFTFLVKPTTAAQRIGVGGVPSVDWKQSRFTLGSLALHAALLALFYFIPPRSSALAIDRLGADSRLVPYNLDARERAEEQLPPWAKQEDTDEEKGERGQRSKDDEGAMGDTKAPNTKHKYALKGPLDNRTPELPRETAKELARTAGVIGLLRASAGVWNSPSSPYGKAEALGNNPEAALGALFGDALGNSLGAGGLGVTGFGRGGGGPALGTIGQGPLATIGRVGSGDYGKGAGGGLRGRSGRVPPRHPPKIDVRGSLSKEVIRRVIHQHLAEVRFCYEQDLRTRPDLQGRVAVRFIIAPTGAVQAAATARSDIGSPRVEHCISEAVQRWAFPAPEGGGLVVVTYPFVLQQTGS